MTITAKSLAALALSSLGLAAGAPSAALAGPSLVRQASAFDLEEIGRDFPKALDTFKRADAEAAAGRSEEAVSLFEEAARLAPTNPAVLRRACEVLTDLGRPAAALDACNRALKYSVWPEEFRAFVFAIMMPGQKAPTTDELFKALSIAGGIAGNHPHLAAGHAALFAIAARMGDRRLMKTHLRELERVAPDGYDARWARKMVAALGPSVPVVLGWLLLGLACAATLARALVRWRARPRLVAKAAAWVLVASVLTAGQASAAPAAGHLSEFQVNDDDPESSIPDDRAAFRRDPLQFGYLIMDLADRADFAIKRKKDYPAAVRYYKALIKTVPDRAIGYAKVCETYEAAGDRASALAYCRLALVHDGVRTDDYDRFVRLALAGEGPLPAADQASVMTVIEYLRKAKDGAPAAADIECQLSVRLGDVARLERCTKELVTLAPESTNNIGYRWSLAILKRDTAGARLIVDQAKQAGFDVKGLEKMTRAAQLTAIKRAVSFGLAAVLIVGAGVLMFRRRREVFAGLLRRSTS
jgi:tetratricopeptide (TPR) repeat protein